MRIRGILLVLAMAALAGATRVHYVDVKCPVCANTFRAAKMSSSNSLMGQDRDFCNHPRGFHWTRYSPWTCRRCFYTNTPEDFAKASPALELSSSAFHPPSFSFLPVSWPFHYSNLHLSS